MDTEMDIDALLGRVARGMSGERDANALRALIGQNNGPAAMCIYCGATIIYQRGDVADMAEAHQRLIAHDRVCSKNPLVAENARLREQLTATREAAQRGMDAATRRSTHELALARQERAASSPELVDSERAANEQLTAEVERLSAIITDCADCARRADQAALPAPARDNTTTNAEHVSVPVRARDLSAEAKHAVYEAYRRLPSVPDEESAKAAAWDFLTGFEALTAALSQTTTEEGRE